MEFIMLLANVIVCLQLNFALLIQHHDDFIPKINSCSKITRFIWAIPGPIRARNRFCRPRRFWIRPKFWIRACVNCCFTSHYDRISVLVCTVEYATKTVVWTRIDRCVFGLTKTHTFENALVWTGPKTKSFSQDFSGTKDAPPPPLSKKFAPYAHAEPKKIVNPPMGLAAHPGIFLFLPVQIAF